MNVKRVFAMALCLCLLLSCVPAVSLPGATVVSAESYSLTIEAEDTTYATWNLYTKEDTGSTSYSGGKGVGGNERGTYPAFDIADSTEDLAAGFVDKSNVPYVAFYVDVPVAGTYNLSTASYFKFSSACDNAYAVFMVNPYDARQETVAHKGYYGVVSGTLYATTAEVAVQLQQGRNAIYVVSATADQNLSWANVDYLKITGSHEVTPVAANAQVLYAGDAPYVYGYTTLNAGGSIGGGSWGTASLMDTSNGQSVNRKRPISEMNAENARTLRGFTYTVNAPADGYYDITAVFNSMGAGDDTRAIGFLVDGVAQAREFTFHTGGNAKLGGIDLSLYLTKGDHVLTITTAANRTSAETVNNADWCDYLSLNLYGGLTKSVIQGNPNMTWWYAEAEYKDQGYTLWHGFNSLDAKRANTYRDYNNANYPDYGKDETRCGIGGGNAANNYSLAQLQEGRLDKTTTTGVTLYVEAKEAGTYDFYAYYYLKCPGIWDTTNEKLTETPFSVFMVNGEFGAKANFLGTGYNWSYHTETVQLQLEKGINEITFIPQTADQYKSGDDWAVVDCIFVDTALQVVKVPTGSQTYNPDQGKLNLYTQINNNYAGYDKRNAADKKNITANNVTKDTLYAVPFVAYTVEAPYDGFYNISVPYDTAASSPVTAADWAMVAFVDDGTRKEIKHIATDRDGTADVSTYLTKGTHTLAITLVLPLDADASVWCNLGPITMNGGLQLAEEQINPLFYNMSVLEAENDAIISRFDPAKMKQQPISADVTVNLASGGYDMGYAYTSTQTTAQVKEHLDPAGTKDMGQPYVEYSVEAAQAGDYTLLVGVRGKFSVGSKILVQVNGVVYEQECLFDDGVNGFQPITVPLEKGRNVVRALGATTDIGWVNQDCLGLPAGLTGHSLTGTVTQQTEALTNTGNYNYKANESGLDNVIVSSVSLDALSEDNFLNASWYSVTVDAPADGYYAVAAHVTVPAMDTAQLGKIGVLANGTRYTAKLWQDSTTAATAEAFVYLNKGLNDLIITGILADSNVAADSNNVHWMDADYLTISSGLAVASTQRYPVQGLVTGSHYTVSDTVVSGVHEATTVGQLKSNFYGDVTVKNGSTVLADTDLVPSGAVVSYEGGKSFTVNTYYKGDADRNDIIDIEDLKAANEIVLGNAASSDVMDILGNDGVNNADVTEYKDIILGKTDADLFYQPNSIGAAEILALCNPVGRLYNYRGAVLMEASASNFTITGDLKGDVVLHLRSEEGRSSGATTFLYVEVDGVVTEIEYVSKDNQALTIAEDLPAGNHVIKVTKGTYSQYEMLYVYAVDYNGTLTKSEPAAHSIEFLGDSITVGYGLRNEDVTQKDTAANPYYTYANVAADLLGADFYSVANSGWRFSKTMYANASEASNFIGRIYNMISMNLNLPVYNFAKQPDVIVINLGTNDAIQFAKASDTSTWTQELYNSEVADLLNQVRTANPNAAIFWVYGAMDGSYDMPNGDDKDEMLQAAIAAYNETVADTALQVTYVDVTADVTGVYAHPSREGHQVIGQELATAIAERMGWALAN